MKRDHAQRDLISITASNADLDPRLCGLYVEAPGTMDYTNWGGASRAGLPIFAGATIPFCPKKITALGGGAAVSGFYDFSNG